MRKVCAGHDLFDGYAFETVTQWIIVGPLTVFALERIGSHGETVPT